MGKVLISLCFILIILLYFSLQTANHAINCSIRKPNEDMWQLKWEAKEGQDQLTYVHTTHWEQVKTFVPWWYRLCLCRHRGKKRALKWRIKLFFLFRRVDPKVAQWILDEYMITTKVEDLPPPENTWVCPHCGTANINTALFCKDCGEYK